jgi:hypothetical protein
MVDAMEPATGPAVWMGSGLAQTDDWNIRLTPADIKELDDALALIEPKNIPIQEITTADFRLPALGLRLRAFAEELENGRGFGVIRGIPVAKYTEESCKILSWGLCTYLGTIIPQSRQGDWINHVIDLTDVTSTTKPDLVHIVNRRELRANHEGGELRWHTDSTDMIALFCLKAARIGGASRLASSAQVHNLILEDNPACLRALYDGYYYLSLADDNHSETPSLSAERVPVYRRTGKSVSFYYIPQVVERAIDRAHVSYSAVESEARELIQSAANTNGVPLEFTLEPGDLEVINNRIVMHAREEYEDYPDIDRRRHLLRLWMAAEPETTTDTFRLPSDRYRARLACAAAQIPGPLLA